MKYTLIIALFILSATGFSQHPGGQAGNHPDVHRIIVKEVLQTTSYTYVHADQDGKLLWIAFPKAEVKEGEVYYIMNGLEMKDFKSKELERTFESVFFMNGLVDPAVVEGGKTVTPGESQQQEAGVGEQDFKIDPVAGGITIKELFLNRDQYANKVVKLRGKVVKYNSRIMGKNWIHLQDGSGKPGEYDLAVTTDGEAKEGEVITIEGIITLDKDFGAGYFFGVIMENGRIISRSE